MLLAYKKDTNQITIFQDNLLAIHDLKHEYLNILFLYLLYQNNFQELFERFLFIHKEKQFLDD